MKVIVFIDRLNKALSLVSRIVSSRSQLPILNNVLISARKGGLFLTTTNLETAITTKITAVVEKEGEITVPVKQIAELVSLTKEEKITMELSGNNLVLKGQRSRNSLNTTPATDFPPIIKKEGEANLIIESEQFKKAINQIAIATSQDESRPILGGAKITKKEKALEIATTDGYRLSIKESQTEKIDIEKAYIFPVRTLLEVIRIAQEQKAEQIKALILGDKNQTVFLFENTEIVTRLIDGEFPNFQKIVPSSFTTQAIIDREELLNSVKIAAIFARESANIIKIKIAGKNLTLSANAPQVGENSAALDVESKGEEVEVAFNFRFLIDFLNVVEEERIIFETNGALSPGVFKAEKDQSFFHIIMPVRVQT